MVSPDSPPLTALSLTHPNFHGTAPLIPPPCSAERPRLTPRYLRNPPQRGCKPPAPRLYLARLETTETHKVREDLFLLLDSPGKRTKHRCHTNCDTCM